MQVGSVPSDGSIAPIQLRYDEIIGAFARERHICYFDATPAMRDSGAGPALRLGRDQHGSPAADDLAAEAFLTSLSKDAARSEGADSAPVSRALRGR